MTINDFKEAVSKIFDEDQYDITQPEGPDGPYVIRIFNPAAPWLVMKAYIIEGNLYNLLDTVDYIKYKYFNG
tara:strand:- start:19 stop:234 length:216 start_codon:yes stop_codon:yes gene_type:complete